MVTTSNHNSRSNHSSSTDVSSGPEAARLNTARRNDGTYVKLFWLGLLVASAAATLAMLVYLYERGERARLAARMTKLSTEGAPIDDASLAKIYQARTSEEMLEQWSKVFALARQIEDPSASGDEKEAKLRLAALRDEVAVAVSADLPCRFIGKFEALYTLIPHTGELRRTTRLLGSHAQAALNTGAMDAALRDSELIQGCARAISADPGAIPQLVSIALQRQALEVYRECIEEDALSETQLSAIIEDCRRLGPIGDRWSLAISGERAMALALMTDLQYDESRAVIDRYFHWSGLRGKGANNTMDLFEKIEAVSVDDLQAMNRQLTEAQNSWERLKQGLIANFENRVASDAVCDFQRLGIRFIYLSMQYRVTAIAAGLRLYHKKFGEFPASLDQLERVGIKPKELRTFSGSAFDYTRSPSVSVRRTAS